MCFNAHFNTHCAFALISLIVTVVNRLVSSNVLRNHPQRHRSHQLRSICEDDFFWFVFCCLCFSLFFVPPTFSFPWRFFFFTIFASLQQYYINGLLAGSLMSGCAVSSLLWRPLQWELCQPVFLWSAGESCSHALHGKTCEKPLCPSQKHKGRYMNTGQVSVPFSGAY